MRRIWFLLLIATAVFLPVPATTAVLPSPLPVAQEIDATLTPVVEPVPDTAVLAQQLWQAMNVEQRVGQLFLVTFEGDELLPDSIIADLILNYHVAGVVLDQTNNNITGYGNLADSPQQVAALTNSLQQLALSPTAVYTPTAVTITDTQSLPITPTLPITPNERVLLPLLIAINQEGDSTPHSQLFNGLTQIPSNMAIGATWEPENAHVVGDIVGRELSAIGINMLLGPVLDVLERPTLSSQNSLGVRVFGGDPYWVGLMGQSYIQGVHYGSDGRVAVIAKHFPGFGASDRALHDEIPTVQKGLSQLELVELAPFIAVAGGARTPEAVVDGFLATHIRYQGFQGNIRATTNPISLDTQALSTLMQLPGFSNWRRQGGLIVSDALGVRAVERFYDSAEQEFPHRIVAKDAFQAGNDLLYLADFALGNAPYEQQLANMQDTILWFRERYQTDVAFRAQVDTAVLRILQLKLRLYNHDFNLDNVLIDDTPEAVTAVVNQSSAAAFDIAQNAITLLYPSVNALSERLSRPPGPGDDIVIFTDLRYTRQCPTCPEQPLISQTAIEERLLSLYGPQSSGEVQPQQIQSYSFADLNEFLAAGSEPIIYNTLPITPTATPNSSSLPESGTIEPLPTATPPPAYLVQEALRDADWIIFAMLDSGSDANALRNFLARRPDLLQGRQLIAFAYNAPYYLDTTEITQLTAYYGLYSKTDAFIDASVRALFQEMPLSGASPVNIDALNYDVLSQTQPTPDQIIPLRYSFGGETIESTAETDPLPVSVGDTLRLETGVIVDRNGNPVPDNTIVQFIEWDRVAGARSIVGEAATRNGIAQWDYLLQARTEGGKFRIGVQAGLALISQELDISVSTSTGVQVEIIDPTPLPTDTPTPTRTASPTPTATATPTLTPMATAELAAGGNAEPGITIELSEILMLTAVTLALVVVIAVATAVGQRRQLPPSQQVAGPVWAGIGGLLLYLYLLLGLPGTAVVVGWGAWAGLCAVLLGGLIALVLFHSRQQRSTP